MERKLQHQLYSKNSIGLLGVGAIGTLIAYHLQLNNYNTLSYFSRTNKEYLKLQLENISVHIPIVIQTAITTPIVLNWLLICLKEHQYLEAQPWFSQLIQPKTKIVVIRNGLNLKDPLLTYCRSEDILECMIDCSVEPIENGYYKSTTTPKFTVPKNKLASSFQKLFESSQVDFHIVRDFKSENWKKLIESSSLGAILCLYNSTCEIFKCEINRHLYRLLINESVEVAKADGAIIESEFEGNMLRKLIAYPSSKGSSMLTDLRQGRFLELGAKNGIISKLGKQYDIATPINDWVIQILTSTD